MPGEKTLYQRFTASAQEPVRLELALKGYFEEESGEEYREAFEAYLKRRIRPAVEALMKADDLPKLQKIEELGWLDAGLVEDCLEMAIRLKKTQAFIWLLGIKAEKHGFPDQAFDL